MGAIFGNSIGSDRWLFFAGLLFGYCPLRCMCICTSFNEISMDVWMRFGSEICAF